MVGTELRFPNAVPVFPSKLKPMGKDEQTEQIWQFLKEPEWSLNRA